MKSKKITEKEKREILEYEALVKELEDSWYKMLQETAELEEARQYGNAGHPAQEE